MINRYATLRELQTVYSYQDLFDMLEMIQIDGLNQAEAVRAAQQKGG